MLLCVPAVPVLWYDDDRWFSKIIIKDDDDEDKRGPSLYMSTHCHSNRRHNQKICHFGVVRLFTTVAAAAVTTWWRTYARRWYEGGRLGGCRQHLHKTFSILIECSQLSSLFLSSLPSCCYKKNTKPSQKKGSLFFVFFLGKASKAVQTPSLLQQSTRAPPCTKFSLACVVVLIFFFFCETHQQQQPHTQKKKPSTCCWQSKDEWSTHCCWWPWCFWPCPPCRFSR